MAPTREDIEALYFEASQAGDMRMAAICAIALHGPEGIVFCPHLAYERDLLKLSKDEAVKACHEAISNANAMVS